MSMGVYNWKKIKNTTNLVVWKSEKKKQLIAIQKFVKGWKTKGIGDPTSKYYDFKSDALHAIKKYVMTH